MKSFLAVSLFVSLTSLALISTDTLAAKGGNKSVASSLDRNEASHLTFMREEVDKILGR